MLPVEGKVMQGKPAIAPNGNVFHKLEEPFFRNAEKDELKPAKLFLCTKDIKIGDKVKERLTTGEWMDWSVDNENDLDLEHQVKVVGEISPRAIWLRDGNLIPKDHIRLFHKAKIGEPERVLWKMQDLDERLRKEFYIAILCTNCLQYH